MRSFQIDCPKCGVLINIPFVEELKARALKDYDLAEISAQEELGNLKLWLMDVSLWGILKWWARR